MAQQKQSYPSSFIGMHSTQYLALPPRFNKLEVMSSKMVMRPNLHQLFRTRRFRVVVASFLVVLAFLYVYYTGGRFAADIYYSTGSTSLSNGQPNKTTIDVDWSRFAYTQYATNTAYLCNSVMIFESLKRFGSKAERVLMYPDFMGPNTDSNDTDSRLLRQAATEYDVKLVPIEIQRRDLGETTWAESYTKLLAFNQTQYDRVLSIDSDATLLQHMDELFHLPPSPVAMPRAYWLDKPGWLSSQLILIEPSNDEFHRIQDAIQNVTNGEFDMEIMNNLYTKDCMIIPHRRYDLLSSEFRSQNHEAYLGNTYEHWDPDKGFEEAKLVHFSDWPIQKPWLDSDPSVVEEMQPNCQRLEGDENREDCRARDRWLGIYQEFKDRRQRVCDIGQF